MPLEEIQTLNQQADRSRRVHAEDENVGETKSPDQAGDKRKYSSEEMRVDVDVSSSRGCLVIPFSQWLYLIIHSEIFSKIFSSMFWHYCGIADICSERSLPNITTCDWTMQLFNADFTLHHLILFLNLLMYFGSFWLDAQIKVRPRFYWKSLMCY